MSYSKSREGSNPEGLSGDSGARMSFSAAHLGKNGRSPGDRELGRARSPLRVQKETDRAPKASAQKNKRRQDTSEGRSLGSPAEGQDSRGSLEMIKQATGSLQCDH